MSIPVFTENPCDYSGETVTARHAPTGEVSWSVCGRDGCAALVASDEAHRSLVHGDNYDGRHRWNVRRRSQYGGAR